MSNRDRRFLNEREAAEFLNLSVRTLQQWRWRGQGPNFQKWGRSVRYAVAELDRFATSNVRRSTSDLGSGDNH